MDSDSDDLDRDIDGLLTDLKNDDPVSHQGELNKMESVEDSVIRPTPSAQNDGSKSATGNPLKPPLGKSVRFNQDALDSASAQDQNPLYTNTKVSPLLNNMFFGDSGYGSKKNDPESTASADSLDNASHRTSSTYKSVKGDHLQNSSSSKTKNATKKLPNDDWLGLSPDVDFDTDIDIDPSLTSLRQVDKTKHGSTKSSFGQKDIFMTEQEFSLPWTSDDKPAPLSDPVATNAIRKPPLPQSTSLKSPKLSNNAVANPQSVDFFPPENKQTPFSHRDPEHHFLTGTGSIINNDYKSQDKHPSSSDNPKLTKHNNNAPTSTILDVLPFLRQRDQTQSDRSMTNVPEGGGGDFGDTHIVRRTSTVGGGPLSTGTKKKVKGSSGGGSGGNGPVHTLQLPSHLVNEDELKAMSASLKALYVSQLEMQEVSYKEQLDFFASSSKRKENLLQEELTTLRDDYEERIKKLRADFLQNDLKTPQMIEQNMSHISHQFEKVSSQMESMKDAINTDANRRNPELQINYDEIRNIVTSEVERNLDLQFKKLTLEIETTMKYRVEQDHSKIDSKFKEFSNGHLQDLKLQNKKLNDTMVQSVVSSVTQVMDTDREVSKRKREMMTRQVKEMRKDLRRLYFEMDNKNDLIQKSHSNMEIEQRNISQTIRDINTILKVTTDVAYRNANCENNSAAAQFASMQAVHANVQNEMEIKLLREERNSLSESIAQINVERRKLADSKLSLEREKMEFEREKNRIRDVEANSKSQVMEAERLKRVADLSRQQESKLALEAKSKLEEVAKEKAKMRQCFFDLEQTLLVREQKLFHEKSEIIREKEFVEKLRDQLLCPGCLKTVKATPAGFLNSHNFSLPPPPYYQQPRSSGDGVDFAGFASSTGIQFTPEEKAYFTRDDFDKYLDS